MGGLGDVLLTYYEAIGLRGYRACTLLFDFDKLKCVVFVIER